MFYQERRDYLSNNIGGNRDVCFVHDWNLNISFLLVNCLSSDQLSRDVKGVLHNRSSLANEKQVDWREPKPINNGHELKSIS